MRAGALLALLGAAPPGGLGGAPAGASGGRALAAEEALPRVVVAGSTGATGRLVAKALQRSGRFRVAAGYRTEARLEEAGLSGLPGVEFVQLDVTAPAAEQAAALRGADAVVCATGFRPGLDFNAPKKVDGEGTRRLVDAAKAAGVKKFVLVTSLLTNAKAVGQGDNPNYKFLNLFGGVLDQKLEAEQHLRASGLEWTIVRPGGLDEGPAGGEVVVGAEDTLFDGAVAREQVAEVCVAALEDPRAANRVVEVVSRDGAPKLESYFS